MRLFSLLCASLLLLALSSCGKSNVEAVTHIDKEEEVQKKTSTK